MDDWPATLFKSGQLGGLAGREVDRLFREVIERSPVLLVIGENMGDAYGKRYDKPTFVVGNSVDLGCISNHSASESSDGTHILKYVGGLHLGRDQLVESLATVIDERCLPWLLELHVPPSDEPVARQIAQNYESVRYRGSIPPDLVVNELAAADALLFLESSHPAIHRFTQLSVSTKVPQYLSSGRPVLAIGPIDQASVSTLIQHGNTLSIQPESSSDKVATTLAELSVKVRGPGTPLTADAKELIDAEATRERLRIAVVSAVDQWDGRTKR